MTVLASFQTKTEQHANNICKKSVFLRTVTIQIYEFCTEPPNLFSALVTPELARNISEGFLFSLEIFIFVCQQTGG